MHTPSSNRVVCGQLLQQLLQFPRHVFYLGALEQQYNKRARARVSAGAIIVVCDSGLMLRIFVQSPRSTQRAWRSLPRVAA